MNQYPDHLKSWEVATISQRIGRSDANGCRPWLGEWFTNKRGERKPAWVIHTPEGARVVDARSHIWRERGSGIVPLFEPHCGEPACMKWRHQRCTGYLVRNPRGRYAFAETGIEANALREKFKAEETARSARRTAKVTPARPTPLAMPKRLLAPLV